MRDAFGVERPGLVAKYDATGGASEGRLVAGGLLQPFHPLVAGKRGKKFRALLSESGGAIVGTTAGSAAGALTRSPQGVSMLGSVGGLGGAMLGTGYAHKKGYLKPEKKR